MTRHIPTEKLDTWLTQMVQGDISSEDLLKLESAMAEDLQVLDYCLEFLAVASGLEWLGREKEGEGADHLVNSLKKGHIKTHRMRSRQPHWVKNTVRVAAMILVGLGIGYGWRFMPSQGLQGDGLAEIVNGQAMMWEDNSLSTQKGTVLVKGERYLKEGVADIRMASGARIVIKGPCRFSLETGNAMGLVQGMIAANVPTKARGFQVRTQYVTVVDYGTEFGVIAKIDGSVETHVFAGKVELVSAGQAPGTGLPLPAGISATVAPGSPTKKAASNPVRFIRALPNQSSGAVPGRRFDLADVVGIGNGYGTGTVGCGLNPANGEVLHTPILSARARAVGGYVFLLNWRYVDGVFVPNGARGDNAVTSSGLIFPDCPVTSGQVLQGITHGAQMAMPGAHKAAYPARLGGMVYGEGKASALGMHANAGITFDLDRIRADHPGVSLKAFKGICGISESAPQPPVSSVEFWVLVDGEVRFQYKAAPNIAQPKPLQIPLTRQARFLTLATTSPGGTEYGWALFAEPYLIMEATP